MNGYKILVLLSALFLTVSLSVSLVSCMDKPLDDEDYIDETEPPFIPAVDDGDESELCSRYEEYRENASLAFRGIETAALESFNAEPTEGGIKIVEYIGNGEIVVIPDTLDGKSVISIGENAFSGKAVRAVSLPDTLKSIEASAFEDCDTLITLKVPFVGDGGENDFLGYIFGASSSDENAVSVPPSLDMLIIDGNVREISENAFAGCKTLSAVVLPDSVETVGKFAFYECFDLVYVSLGDGAKNIAEYAFGYCQSLYSVDCTNADKIGKGAFYACRSLNNMTLPFVGESAEDNGFLGYIFGAETADFNDEFVPPSLRRVIIGEGCLNIPDRAFTSCERLTEVVLPEGIVDIGIRAFYKCRSLIGAELPESLVSVEDDAFFMCESLSSVSFGNKLESLGMQAFYGCNSLREVVLPDSLGELKAATFYGCSSLADVSLGGVKKIGKDAFGGCPMLTDLILDGIEAE